VILYSVILNIFCIPRIVATISTHQRINVSTTSNLCPYSTHSSSSPLLAPIVETTHMKHSCGFNKSTAVVGINHSCGSS